MSAEPESPMLRLLRDIRAEIGDVRAEMAADMIDLRREIGGVRKDLSEQIVGLRRALAITDKRK